MMIQQRDAKWWYKLNGATRLAIVKGALNSLAKPIVVTEYPKSGGTWLSQMISTALEIRYPRNRLPHFGKQLIHGCYLKVNENVDTIVVWRDGRDTMVSFYFHLMFDKPITSLTFSKSLIKKLDIEDKYDVERYLPRFIEWCFEGGYPGYSWAHFARIWLDRSGYATTSYEAVSENPLRELKSILGAIGRGHFTDEELQKIVDEYSFENQSSRPRGEEDVTSFIRKGIVGDWKNRFNSEARAIFDHYAGAELIELGYETNRDWVATK